MSVGRETTGDGRLIERVVSTQSGCGRRPRGAVVGGQLAFRFIARMCPLVRRK